jgi:hypothetical protein
MRFTWICLWLVLVLVGCTTGPAASDSPEETPTTVSVTTETTGIESSPVDLSARPLVWLNPQPFTSIRQVFEGGSVDFFEMFPEGAPWAGAAQKVHVFKLYEELGLGRVASNEEWQLAIEGIESRGMALALELGPLPTGQGCGGGEGYGANYSLDQVRKVQRLGGRVDIVAFGSPYGFGHFWDDPADNPCQWSLERVAAETASFVTRLREIEPDIVVGGIEPLWPGLTASDFGDWMDAYEEAAGEPLGFLHLDVDWTRHDWPEVALQVEGEARNRGVPFGLIYNGGEQVETDDAWTQLTAERMYIYEELIGGQPDHLVIQSWHVQPSRVLPDTSPSTLTGLVNRYFGSRSHVQAEVTTASSGLSIRGDLATSAGAPVSGVPLDVVAVPIDGVHQVLERTGTVPADVEMAEVGIRLNTEGGGPGAADIRLYEIAYYEGDDDNNRVTDPSFSGLAGFGIEGTSVVPSDLDGGTMLRLTVAPDQEVNLGSNRFPVTPGASYRLEVQAAIPGDSAQAGFAVVVFLADTEKARHILPLAPVPIPLANVITGSSGEFEVDVGGLAPGRYRLIIEYIGDLDHWPALFEQDVTVG